MVTGVGCSVQLESSVEFGFGFEFYWARVSFFFSSDPRAESRVRRKENYFLVQLISILKE